MNRVLREYQFLLKTYGKQNWWPAESEFEIVVGALLTQNTRWENVEMAIRNLKNMDALNPQKIIGMDIGKLAEAIRPSGFYKQKASALKALTKKYLDINRDADIMEIRNELLKVKRIGKETADSIILYAFEKPIFVIDAYTRRFCKEKQLCEFKEYDEYRFHFERNLPRDVGIYKEYHALIVRWGKEQKKNRKNN